MFVESSEKAARERKIGCNKNKQTNEKNKQVEAGESFLGAYLAPRAAFRCSPQSKRLEQLLHVPENVLKYSRLKQTILRTLSKTGRHNNEFLLTHHPVSN